MFARIPGISAGLYSWGAPAPLAIWTISAIISPAAFPARAGAHPSSLSRFDVVLGPGTTHVTISLNPRDLAGLLPAGVHATSGSALSDWVRRQGGGWVELRLDGAALPPGVINVQLEKDGSMLLSCDDPPAGAAARVLEIRSPLLSDLPAGHQQLLRVRDARQAGAGAGTVLVEVALDQRQSSWRVDLPAGPGYAPSRLTFFRAFRQGIIRLLSRPGPLLFLAVLLLTCDRPVTATKRLAPLALAQAIGLALVAFDAVRLPGWVVELAVAASVIYLAAEGLLGRRRLPRPGTWTLVILCLGVIQGLGLAPGFTQGFPPGGTGLPRDAGGLILPLAGFILGVATAQLALTAAALPIILLLRRGFGGFPAGPRARSRESPEPRE